MTPLGGRCAMGGELVIEVDPHRSREVPGLVGGATVTAVEVPADVDQHRARVLRERVVADQDGNHRSIMPARSPSANIAAVTSVRGRLELASSQNERVSLDAAEKFFALLAIVAGAGAVALIVARLVPGARRYAAELHPISLWLAWLVAATSTVGSLYFSESHGLTPCTYCWYQRIAMYPLSVVLLIAAIRRDHSVRRYAAPVAAIGLAISIYHRLLEAEVIVESDSCGITSCSSPYFYVFDVFTLATMAMCGFAAILALLLLVPSRDADAGLGDEARDERDELISS